MTSSRVKLRIIRAVQSPILTFLFLEAWKADLTWCQYLICRRYVGEVWLAWSDKVIRYKKKISQPCNHISHAKGKGRGKDGRGARHPYKLFAAACDSFLGECSSTGVQSAFLSFSLLSFHFYDASSWCRNPFGLDVFPHTPPFLADLGKGGPTIDGMELVGWCR